MLDVDSTQKQKKENLGNNKKVVSPFGDWGIIQGPWMFPNYHEPNVTEFQPVIWGYFSMTSEPITEAKFHLRRKE